MRVGSLFSGIGGFDLGFERAGMSVVWQSEIDPYAAAILKKHWPHVPNLGDVRSVRGDAVEPVDIICGGFPCQDISLAGRGAGIDGERSGLWSEYARLIREMRPRWVVAENVPALRTRGYDRVADDLEAAGYAVWPFVVGADDVGAPHRRKRAWVVAHAKELGSPLGHAGAIRAGATPFEPERRSSANAVAHADAQRREQQRRSGLLDGERPAQRDDADGCRGARVSADTEREGLARREGEPGHARQEFAPAERDRGRRAWESGPPVPGIRRVDDGVPHRIYGDLIDAVEMDCPESGATPYARPEHSGVHGMRRQESATAPPSRLREACRVCGALPGVPHKSRHARWASPNEAAEAMQGMREGFLSDAQQETFDMRPRMLVDPWSCECVEALASWRSGSPVSAVEMAPSANRRKRLAALGNAVLPQIAEAIGRAIMTVEQSING